MCSSGFVSFFPQKMSYLQSCVGCTCVLLSLIGKVRQQQLLWPYCCCCAGRLLVLSEGNEQRVFNRIKKDECEQQLLVQLVQCLVVLSRTLRDISTPVKTPVLAVWCVRWSREAQALHCTNRRSSVVPEPALLRDSEPSNCTCFGTFQSSAGASE